MRGAVRWLPLLSVAALAAAFAALNRGERVVVDVGVATFYRVSLTGVVFVAFVAGMGTMMLLSLRQDLALRRELRGREAAAEDRTVGLPADRRPPERPAHAEGTGEAEQI